MTNPSEESLRKPKSTTKDQLSEVTVRVYDLLQLVWMARRYAHGRNTYAPDLFNEVYDRTVKANNLVDQDDSKAVPTFPKAN